MIKQRNKINYNLKNSIQNLSDENQETIFKIFGPIEELLKISHSKKEFVIGICVWLSIISKHDSK